MNGMQFRTDGRGVTPVVGIILMISITVLLAATVGAFVMGMDDEGVQQQAPMVAVQFDYHSGASDVLKIVHDTGGSLDEDQTYVGVKDARCSSTGTDPDGQYQASADFGQAQPLGAGMTLTVDGDLPTASSDPCPSGDLDLSKATVTVVWRAADGTQSSTVATWHGPDASY